MNRARTFLEADYAYRNRIYGEGIGIAIVDTGIFPHPDFTKNRNRIVAFHDILHQHFIPYDDNGHGTHVSGIAAGNGFCSQNYYAGIAPLAHLIAIKVLDQDGNGKVMHILRGFDWIVKNKDRYGIRIVNISIGGILAEAEAESNLIDGVNMLWDKGLVVVAAAGNNGPRVMSISAPGISKKIITVGASDDHIPVELKNSRRIHYSGRGPTSRCIQKPDIIAPGSNIVSCSTNSTNYYITKSGTSMATPLVSGCLALLLSKYPDMSNRDVKIRLKDRAIDLGQATNKQGWGTIHLPTLLQ